MTLPFDDIRLETLREIGAVKWSGFPDKIGAFIAEMDFGTAPPITEALHAAVEVGNFGYLPETLCERMAEAYVQWSRTRYGWDIPPANVRPLADVLAGLTAAIEHFSTPGSPVIVPTPAYMPFLTVPRMLDRKVIQVPMTAADGRLAYDLDALDAAFRDGGNLLVLCNPHNPIGRVLERAEMAAIAEVVARHGGRVFADEVHAPLVFPNHRHIPYASISPLTAGHTVTATSASKAWNLPGLKCAQLILSNNADRERWSAVSMLAEHGAANLGVIANIAAYTAGGQRRCSAYLDGRRALLAQLLSAYLPQVRYRDAGRCSAFQGGGEGPRGRAVRHGRALAGWFCCSMYCFMTLSGTPPAEPAKYEPDQSLLAQSVVPLQVGEFLSHPAAGHAETNHKPLECPMCGFGTTTVFTRR